MRKFYFPANPLLIHLLTFTLVTVFLTACDGKSAYIDRGYIPVAAAGDDQNTRKGEMITLDASNSSESNGEVLSYRWELIEKPVNSNAVIIGDDTISPTFTPDIDGTYVIQLIVNDGKTDSKPDQLTIIVGDIVSNLPIANAGMDQTGTIGDLIQLEGSGTSDGDNLTFIWKINSQPEGSIISLNNPDIFNPSFNPDKEGRYVLALIVKDKELESVPDEVVLQITTKVIKENTKPVAVAGQNQEVIIGSEVLLTGSASTDTDNDDLTYNWALKEKPQNSLATISDASHMEFSFIPDVAGEYLFQLTVNDGMIDSIPDTLKVMAVAVNIPPNKICTPNATSSKSCSIDNGLGTQIRACAVDGLAWGGYEDCTVTSCNSGYHQLENACVVDIQNNMPPTVNAGSDKTLKEGDLASFLAIAFDDGEIVKIEWLNNKGELLGSELGLALTNLKLGSHVLTVKVTDNGGLTTTDDIKVTIEEDATPLGFLSGKITDQKGVLIPNAKVTLASGETTLSNNRGDYSFTNIAPTKRTTVSASRNSFLQNSKTIEIKPGKETLQNIVLSVPKNISFIAPKKEKVITSQGMTITLPKDGFVDKNGDKVESEISLSSSYFPITTEEGVNEFPGDLKAVRTDGEPGDLTSFGFIKLELKDKNGNDISIAPGEKIELSIPADDKLDKPATIPFWYFDEEKGVWVEDGEAIYDPDTNTYKTAVSTVNRTFNLDAFSPERLGSLELCVEDMQGNKVEANILIEPENKSWKDSSKTSKYGLLKLEGLVGDDKYNIYAVSQAGKIGSYVNNPFFLARGDNKLTECLIVDDNHKTQQITISGLVKSSSGDLIPDNEVTLYGYSEGLSFGKPSLVELLKTRTNQSGQYNFEFDKSSVYALEAAVFGKDIVLKSLTTENIGQKSLSIVNTSSIYNDVNITISVNNPPIANAGLDEIVFVGDQVSLNASKSYDPDTNGSINEYEWRLGDQILGTLSSFSSSALPLGEHIIVLTVTDQYGLKASDEIKVSIVEKQKHFLYVDAGKQRTIYTTDSFAAISLGGTDTISVGSSINRVQWKEGNNLLSEDTDLNLYLSGLSVGTHTITLLVRNAHGLESSDTVDITVIKPSVLFIEAGIDKTVRIGEVVEIKPLIRTSYNVRGYYAGLVWTEENTVLDSDNTASGYYAGTFNYTGKELGTHILKLTVTDDQGLELIDTLKVTVTPSKPLTPLFVNAGADTTVYIGENTNLYAMGELQFGSSFKWTEGGFLLGEEQRLQYSGTEIGRHVINLTVTNSITGQSDTDEVTIYVKKPADTEKNVLIVNAGLDKTVYLNETLKINGTHFSSSNFGSNISYSWTDEGGSDFNSGRGYIKNLTYEATELGTHTIKLRVTDHFRDGSSIESTDEMVVTVIEKGVNNLATDQIIYLGGSAPFIFNKSEYSSISWEVDGIQQKDVSDLPFRYTFAYSPQTIGNHLIKITAIDANGVTIIDEIKITVLKPEHFFKAYAGRDFGAYLGNTVKITGNILSSHKLYYLADSDLSFTWKEGNKTLHTGGLYGNGYYNYYPTSLGLHTLQFIVTRTGDGVISTDEIIISVTKGKDQKYLIADAGKDMVVYEGGAIKYSSFCDDTCIKAKTTSSEGITKLKWMEGDVVLSNQWIIREYTPSGLGQHILKLIIEDSEGNVATDEMVVTVIPDDRNPHVLAQAGFDQEVYLGETTRLSSGSYFTSIFTADRNYQWIEGSTILSTKTWFDYKPLTLGEHTIRLINTDSNGYTDTDEVVINVIPNPREVFADAGKDRIIYKNSDVSLDMSGSYSLRENWKEIKWEENGIVISTRQVFNYNSDVIGDHLITLTVEDYDGLIDTDEVIVSIVDDSKIDNTSPIITLNGDSLITIKQGDLYVDQGAIAKDDRDGIITSSITTRNTLFTTFIPGEFTTYYSVRDKAGNTSGVTRTIIIEESNEIDIESPVITLIGDNPVSFIQGTEYNDAGITVLDNRDGEIGYSFNANVNNNIPGRYEVIYTAIDNAGNTSKATRVVNVLRDPNIVIDTTKPIIALIGESIITLVEGTPYIDQGATAIDNIDGDITVNITTDNPVDINIVKDYTITYSVKDKAGNEATLTRAVKITKKPDEPDTLPPILVKSLEWLETQKQADGSYTNNAKISMAWQSTAEVLRAYYKVGETSATGIAPAKAYLSAEDSKKIEALARKIIIGSESGDDVSAMVFELTQLQNIDSGFGDQAHYHSRVTDTAFALKALGMVGNVDSKITGFAISYLKKQQSADGGFSHSSKNDDSIYETALSLMALQEFQLLYSLESEINSATAYLLDNQSNNDTTSWEAAYALLAIKPTIANKAAYRAATDSLKTAQLSNGSWSNEVYTTALVIRAIYKAENALKNL